MRLCKFLFITWLAVFALFASWHAVALQAESPALTFYAMGDVPYASAEDELLPRQIAALPSDAAFVVHLGDIKKGSTPCNEAVYAKVAGMLRKSSHRVFIVPGDNEWNDCQDPDSSWAFWVKHFMRFDRHWESPIKVSRQPDRQENFAFTYNRVLFIGINIVGGRVHDPAEWKQRHQQDIVWIGSQLKKQGEESSSLVLFGHAQPAVKHKDFFRPLSEIARGYKKPVLYIHGDGHRWHKHTPFPAKNILCVQVDQGGIASPLKVTVGRDAKEPFTFDRRN